MNINSCCTSPCSQIYSSKQTEIELDPKLCYDDECYEVCYISDTSSEYSSNINDNKDDNKDDKNNINNYSIMPLEFQSEIKQYMLTNKPCKIIHKPSKLYEDSNIFDLSEVVTVYDDEIGDYNINKKLMDEITNYATKINCSDFHGKGTIDDYSELFNSVSRITSEYKQIQIDMHLEGFDDFSKAAEEMNQLFESFTIKLQNINIINDTHFLITISNALEKMCKLSETFGKFKDIILATTDVQIPKSVHETSELLTDVMIQVNCAMNYITHFVNPNNNPLLNSELSVKEKNIIDNAVKKISNWSVDGEQQVKKIIEDNEDIKVIKQYNESIKKTSDNLKNAVLILKNKLNNYKDI